MKHPVVDLSECILCGVCIEACPEVFSMNAAGFIDVAQLSEYPAIFVNDAINCCPTDCINWQEE